MKLQGKAAIVTGAGRGIGEAISLALAREGADVALAARTVSQIEAAAAKIRGMGRRAIAQATDVSSEADVKRLVDRANREFGKVDILVNNAGITGPMASVLDMDMAEMQRCLDVNLKGVVLCTRAVLGQMIQRKKGKIISISSLHGRRGAPYVSAYSMSKAAIVAFTQSLAREVARYGINVNVICPHGMTTQLSGEMLAGASAAAGVTPEERMRVALTTTKWGAYPPPEAIAPLVVFLASPDSDPMTEQVLDFP